MATLFLRLAYRSGRDVSSKTITRALKYDQLKGGHNPAQRHLYSSGLNLLRNTGFHRRGSSSAGSKRAFSGDVPKSSNGASIQSDSRDYDKSKSSDTEISFVGTGGLGSSQSHNSSAASSSTRQDPPPRGRLERLKAGWKKYGMVGVGAYVGIQLTTIGLLWAGLEFDVLHTGSLGFDVHTLLNRVSLGNSNLASLTIHSYRHPYLICLHLDGGVVGGLDWE
jgi:hypothetical protein